MNIFNMTFNIDLAALYNERGKYTDFDYEITKEIDPISGSAYYDIARCGYDETLVVDGELVEVVKVYEDYVSIANYSGEYDTNFRLSKKEFDIVSHGMLEYLPFMYGEVRYVRLS